MERIVAKYDSKLWGPDCTIYQAGAYGDGATYLRVRDTHGTPIATLTVCSPPSSFFSPTENIFLVKSWSENKETVQEIRSLNIFTDTGRRLPAGYVEIEVWRLKSLEEKLLIEALPYVESRVGGHAKYCGDKTNCSHTKALELREKIRLALHLHTKKKRY